MREQPRQPQLKASSSPSPRPVPDPEFRARIRRLRRHLEAIRTRLIREAAEREAGEEGP